MIQESMYKLAVDMVTKLSTIDIADDHLQTQMAVSILKASLEQYKSEATMFKALGLAALIIHRYEQ